jgi:hypothetical protein
MQGTLKRPKPAKPTSSIAHVDPSPGGAVAGEAQPSSSSSFAGAPEPLIRCRVVATNEERLRFCQAKEGATAMQITSFKDMYIAELQGLASMERQMGEALQ